MGRNKKVECRICFKTEIKDRVRQGKSERENVTEQSVREGQGERGKRKTDWEKEAELDKTRVR